MAAFSFLHTHVEDVREDKETKYQELADLIAGNLLSMPLENGMPVVSNHPMLRQIPLTCW